MVATSTRRGDRMKYEWKEDVWTDWRFLMPKLSCNQIRQLGTWDLADFTFGPPTLCTFGIKFRPRKWPILVRLFWRIENILRLMSWVLFLKRHITLYRIISKIRNLAFEVSDWLSWLHFEKELIRCRYYGVR